MIRSVLRAYVDGFAAYGAAHHCHVLDLQIHLPVPLNPDRKIDAPDRHSPNERGATGEASPAEKQSGWLDARHPKARL